MFPGRGSPDVHVDAWALVLLDLTDSALDHCAKNGLCPHACWACFQPCSFFGNPPQGILPGSDRGR